MEYVFHSNLDLKVACDKKVVSSPIRQAILEGWYELEESLLAAKYIREDDAVLELGGGLGVVSAFVQKIIKPRSYNLFEPYCELHPLIEATALKNGTSVPIVDGRVLTCNLQILRRGFINFFLNTDFWANSIKDAYPGMIARQVAVLSFDKYLKQLRPTFMICDIEGGEIDLFGERFEDKIFVSSQRPEALSSLRGIIMEVHPYRRSCSRRASGDALEATTPHAR